MVTEKQLANLDKGIPINKRGKDEATRLGRKGGIASGEARREKKSYRECAKYLSSLAIKDAKEIETLAEQGIDKNDMTHMMALTYAMLLKAKKGNSQMARLVMELMGEVKEQQTNVTVNNVNPYANLSEEELRKLANEE